MVKRFATMLVSGRRRGTEDDDEMMILWVWASEREFVITIINRLHDTNYHGGDWLVMNDVG
jgi:hypothetical protein